MAWDSKRPVPWKRLAMYLAIYALAMAGFTAVTGGDVGALIAGLIVGIPIAGLSVIILAKFGYLLPILKSREQHAAERTVRIEQRRARNGASSPTPPVPGPRPKPAPTRRTSTGPSQNRRKR